MKSSMTTTKTIAILCLLAIAAGWLALARAAGDRPPRPPERPSREYEVIVPPYQSDMARMVGAYERLSDQYLTLVQQSLAGMDENDRMILRKLESLEKKLDELSKKVDSLNPPKPPENNQ